MPEENTTPKMNMGCGTCAAEAVCKWRDSVRDIERLAKSLSFECKSHIPKKINSQKSTKVCEICGQKTFELYECDRCHKKVCGDCVEIEQILDINTGKAEEETLCKHRSEED